MVPSPADGGEGGNDTDNKGQESVCRILTETYISPMRDRMGINSLVPEVHTLERGLEIDYVINSGAKLIYTNA